MRLIEAATRAKEKRRTQIEAAIPQAWEILEYLNSVDGQAFIKSQAMKNEPDDRLSEVGVIGLLGGVVEVLLLAGDDLLPGSGMVQIRMIIERGQDGGLKFGLCEVAKIGSPETISTLAFGSNHLSPETDKIAYARVHAIEKARRTGLKVDDYRALHVRTTQGVDYIFAFVKDLTAEQVAALCPGDVATFYAQLEKKVTDGF